MHWIGEKKQPYISPGILMQPGLKERESVPISYISDSLGHVNIATTENYLSSFTDETVKSNAGLLLDF